MRRSLLLIALLGLTYSTQLLLAQGWRKTFTIEDTTGTASYSLFRDVQATADGGYLLYGQAFSSNQLALWKIDTYGNTQWSKTLGTGAETEAHSNAGNLHILGDSAIYISGRFSGTPQLPPQHGVMRLNMQGEVQWMKRYFISDTLTTVSTAFTPTTDGHFITGSETLAGDSLLIQLHKIDQQGNVVWERIYPRFSYYDEVLLPYLADITPLSGGGYIATGSYISTLGLQSSHIIRLDDNGVILSQFNLMGLSDEIYTHRVEETTDGNYIVCGSSDGNFISPGFVKKITPQGEEIWNRGCPAPATDIERTPAGEYLVAGGLEEYPLGTNIFGCFVYSFNENGDSNWEFRDWLSFTNPGFAAITAGTDASCVAAGINNSQAYAVKLDSLGNVFTHTLQGTIQRDEDADCALDSTALPLSGWNITVSNGTTDYYATTDSNGFYSMTLDTGSYSVSVTPPNALWVPCQAVTDTVLEGFYEETLVNFPVQTQVDCPLMSVDVSVPFLRRCFPNTYSVRYCNEGTAVANNAAVEIHLDEYLTLESAELPYSTAGDQAYRFELGDLPPNSCGQFRFTAHLDCNETQLGQTHCVEALVFPDTLCVPTPPAPLIEADSRCEGDSVVFVLRNIGSADMESSASYIVIEDDVMFLTQPFELEEGDSIEIRRPATGATYRVQAPRRPGVVPGELISSTLEGCVSDNQIVSLGFFNSFPLYGGGGFSDLDCRENVGAYDPNDKQGFPTGAGPEHFIEPDTRLEYLIRFQNTGTDTAFYVAIRDTLSEWLHPATVTPGASSHPYTWRLGQDGTLLFEFDHIMLPDSNVNEPASHGFVKFGIDHKPYIPLGTDILNQAAIFFDFNAPIITNTTIHRVDTGFLQSPLAAANYANENQMTIQVAPNPASQKIRFERPPVRNTHFGQILIYSSSGRQIATYTFPETEKSISVHQWPAGIYFYEVRVGAEQVSGKFLIQR